MSFQQKVCYLFIDPDCTEYEKIEIKAINVLDGEGYSTDLPESTTDPLLDYSVTASSFGYPTQYFIDFDIEAGMDTIINVNF